MNIDKINDFLKEGVAIIPGFQGISNQGKLPRLEEEAQMHLR